MNVLPLVNPEHRPRVRFTQIVVDARDGDVVGLDSEGQVWVARWKESGSYHPWKPLGEASREQTTR